MSIFCTIDKKLCLKAESENLYANLTLDLDASLGFGAFGTGSMMEGSDMIIIWNINNKVAVANRKGVGHDIGIQSNDWNILSTSVANNRMTANVSRLMVQPGKPSITPALNPFIWCWGLDKVTSLDVNSPIPYHDLSGTFRMNLQNGQVIVLEIPSSDLQTAHGVLMCVTWFMLMPISILLTRYLKCKIKNWLKYHIALNCATALLSTVALILILIDREGIVFRGNALDPHPIFGIVIMVLFFAQSSLGVYIDKTFISKRTIIPVRDKAHWYIGYFILYLCVITLFLGMKSAISKQYGYIFIGVFALFFVIWIVLNIKIGRVNEPATTTEDTNAISVNQILDNK